NERLLEVVQELLARLHPGGLQHVQRDLEIRAARERHLVTRRTARHPLERLVKGVPAEPRGVHERAVDVPQHEPRAARGHAAPRPDVMNAIGTATPAERRSVAIFRPGWTASRGSLSWSPSRAIALSSESTVKERPQKSAFGAVSFFCSITS